MKREHEKAFAKFSEGGKKGQCEELLRGGQIYLEKPWERQKKTHTDPEPGQIKRGKYRKRRIYSTT